MLYDLIIIGGGPAGVTAGIYAGRKRLKTLLLTQDFLGQVAKTSEVDNWPGASRISGIDLAKKFEEHLRNFSAPKTEQGIEIKTGEKVIGLEKKKKVFFVETETKQEFRGKAVIAATGQEPRRLNVPGAKELAGHGVSFCSTCDAPFFQDKQTAVAGGGNAGLEAALDLVKYAKKVFVLERGARLTADEVLQERARKQAKVEIFLNTELKKIQGKAKVQSITYYNLKKKKTYQLPIEGVFFEIGSEPKTEFLQSALKLNKQGEVKVDPRTCQTSVKGLFAAGDITDTLYKQIVTAAGQGCIAALSAYQYLQNN